MGSGSEIELTGTDPEALEEYQDELDAARLVPSQVWIEDHYEPTHEVVAANTCWECGAPDDAVILWESELGGYICEWCAGLGDD